MRKEKFPRCYKYFKDDRICDICPISKECDNETNLKYESERRAYSCSYREMNTGDLGNYFYMCRKDTYDSCKPKASCFPDLVRKEKLKILSEQNIHNK